MNKLIVVTRAILYRLQKICIMLFEDVSMEGGVVFRRYPHILKHKSAKILIGEGTVINSSNHGYHINMFSKCKLYADRPNSNIKIGKNCRIHGTCIHAFKSIEIGDNCLIAANTQIVDGNAHLLSFDRPHDRINTVDQGKPIIIADNVWIAANCFVLGGTNIGQGSVITAGSVVKGDVPPNCIFGGNPGVVIKQY